MNAHQVVVSTEISAPPGLVWELVTDIGLMPRFSSELQNVEWAEGFHTAALGAQFIGTNRHPRVGEWRTLSQIVEFEPERSFGWAVGSPENAAAFWRFDLEPLPAATRLSYVARLGPGSSGVTMLIAREPDRADDIIAGRLEEWRAGMAATLAGIRQLAEARSTNG